MDLNRSTTCQKSELCGFLTKFMEHLETHLNDSASWEIRGRHTKKRHTFVLKHKLSKWKTEFEINSDLDIEIEEDYGDHDDELLDSFAYMLKPTEAHAKDVAKTLRKAMGDAEYIAERRMVLEYLSSTLDEMNFKFDIKYGKTLEIEIYRDKVITVKADEGDVHVWATGEKPRVFKLADPQVHYKIAQETINQLASAKAQHALKTAFKANVDYEAVAKLLKPQLSPAMRSHLSRIFNQIGELREKHAEIVESEKQDVALNSTT